MTNEKAYEIAKTIKDFCTGKRCEDCVFWNPDKEQSCLFNQRISPEDWELIQPKQYHLFK